MRIGRRDVILSGLGLGIAFAAGPRLERANWAAPSTFGLAPLGGTVDQTTMLQQAIDTAAKAGEPVYLPPATIRRAASSLDPARISPACPANRSCAVATAAD